MLYGIAMGRRVLIVDDSKTTLQVVQIHLMGRDLDFDVAANAEDAVQVLESNTPHLVISDIEMPGMSGIDLCKRLRHSHMYRKIPFIIVTSSKEDKKRREAFAAGVDGYLTKPLDPARLTALVDRLLSP